MANSSLMQFRNFIIRFYNEFKLRINTLVYKAILDEETFYVIFSPYFVGYYLDRNLM